MFKVGDKVFCYQKFYEEKVITGTIKKVITDRAIIKQFGGGECADERFNKVLYGIKLDDRTFPCNHEGLYYFMDFAVGKYKGEVFANLEQIYNSTRAKYLNQTTTLKDLARFMLLTDIHSENCDKIAREVAFQRCEQFGVYREDGVFINEK